MLLITDIKWSRAPTSEIDNVTLFNQNSQLYLMIEAPLVWWFSLMYMTDNTLSLTSVFNSQNINDIKLGDTVSGSLYISYQELVGMVQDYDRGIYEVSVPKREWRDFIETISDIKGVSYCAKEEE